MHWNYLGYFILKFLLEYNWFIVLVSGVQHRESVNINIYSFYALVSLWRRNLLKPFDFVKSGVGREFFRNKSMHINFGVNFKDVLFYPDILERAKAWEFARHSFKFQSFYYLSVPCWQVITSLWYLIFFVC